MGSDDSEDEPLSLIAASKKLNPSTFEDLKQSVDFPKNPPGKRKKKRNKDLSDSVMPDVESIVSPNLIDRPEDVWLYFKDFNLTGPYSCLLCSEWFINRSKIIVHYVLNHNKDFCGICRYFVPDREAWIAHQEFHKPWHCSQCSETFTNDLDLRQHFSSIHNLVHCRLCYFRIPDNDQYNCHLFKKHNVTNITSKSLTTLWELDHEESTSYLCLLCSKSNNLAMNFFNHYMCYHHMTLKCFSFLISGTDPPFKIVGAKISTEFLNQLKTQMRYGYIDFDENVSNGSSAQGNGDKALLLRSLMPEVKLEHVDPIKIEPLEEIEEESDTKSETKQKRQKFINDDDKDAIWNVYEGDDDFDVTATELVTLQECYFDYVNRTLNIIESKTLPDSSEINYSNSKSDTTEDIDCPMCANKSNNLSDFSNHVNKMHGVRTTPLYSCRICAASFETDNELTSHVTEEMGEFEDLWICQFCDHEYDSREATRQHMNEHWDILDADNCFSPHLGFKCRYCPTLFWNEPEREEHQKRVHFTSKHMEDFYRCEPCDELFADKVWYIHHYMSLHQSQDDSHQFLLKCCLCCIVLPDIEEMRSHFNDQHKEARKIFCSLGGCSFKPLAQKKSFKMHVKSLHGGDRSKPTGYPCRVCSEQFATARGLGGHMAHHHGAGRYKCKICGEMLHTLDERKLHYLLSHPGRHPFSCNECPKSFPYKSSLYAHKALHRTDQEPFTCSYCNKIFAKKDSYREHLQIHEGPRHACSYCPMRFVQRSNMLRHERRHTGERPYSCAHCDRTFSDKGACSSHMRTHVKGRAFTCLYCGQTFAQKSKLTYHTRKHTGENLETCETCSKKFTSPCSLREHMKTHNKICTVPCSLCERKFPDNRCMLRHFRTAHSSTEHQCPLCGKKLTSISGLRQHVITHSAVKTFRCNVCPKAFAIKRSILKHLRRRHGVIIEGSEANWNTYFTTLDIRQCNLGLDEEALTRIFGPPKEALGITFGDFNDYPDPQNPGSEESDSDSDGKVKKEPESGGELEPTDFVSVKIEQIDPSDPEVD